MAENDLEHAIKLDGPEPGMLIVSRISAGKDEAPCDGAFRVLLKHVDSRTIDDPTKIEANDGTDGGWYDRGENHRVVNGCICRDLGWKEEWAIRAELFPFIEKYGPCVVYVGLDNYVRVEIYDGYRE